MLLLLALVFIPAIKCLQFQPLRENNSIVCEITVPIGAWLKNNTGPCAVVKGHFLLNKAANKYTRQIFYAFSNLKRIEGCIYVREYTGSTNLSFFNNLEEVICNKTAAKRSHLTNVIDVVAPELKTMGFNSLTTVEGPGQIVLSYEEEQSMYIWQTTVDGEQCFSKKEQIFLAYHPQFRRTMYQTCEVDDRCFRLENFKWFYTAADIPQNCTVFVGMICLWVERPNINENFSKTCIEMTNTHVLDATQFVHVHFNRFLTNISLPSLQPIRPLDISRNEEAAYRFGESTSFALNDMSFLPDTIGDQCAFFPNLTCGYYVNADVPEMDLENKTWIEETWLMSMVAVAIGMAFSIRSMVLLQFSYASRGLPYSRSLIILVIFVSTLVALESCIFYQRTYTVFTGIENGYYYFPQFKSTLFIYPPIQWAMTFLVACKHACLAILVSCYIDIIIFYRTGSYRISSKYCAIVFCCAIFLSLYLNTHLFVTIRGRRPNYSKDRNVIFIPFILNTEYAKNFTKFVPEELYLRYYDGILRMAATDGSDSSDFRLDEIPLENFGQSLTGYSNICDILMITVVILFYILTQRHVIIPRHSFTIIIALYLQLSANRIRHYVYSQILITDFCRRKDYNEKAWLFYELTCWKEYYYQNTLKWDPINGFPTVRDVAFMDKTQWEILEKILEKLPYFSYPIVSFYCYVFAKFHHYFGAVVYYQETKKPKAGSAILPVTQS